MTKATTFPSWRDTVIFAPEGPQPQILMDNDRVKIIMAGLEPGQKIPEHAENSAMYHFLEGSGWMIVDDERIPVQPGVTIVMPDGAVRGLEAETRLAFLATRFA